MLRFIQQPPAAMIIRGREAAVYNGSSTEYGNLALLGRITFYMLNVMAHSYKCIIYAAEDVIVCWSRIVFDYSPALR